jgi:ArsR family transcriptional regulator
MTESLDTLLSRLRAVAEPTRLRMLAILAHGEFSVTELTRILGQSQPRVSRHLKLLGDCGLLERFREQHWIFYRLPVDTPAGRFARELLGGLDADNPELASDRTRVAAVLEERSGQTTGVAAPDESRDGRPADTEVAELLAGELGEHGLDALLYFGCSPGDVLGSLGRRARRAVGMNGRRLEVQRARAMLHSRGLNHCVLQQGDLRALPQASASFDLVVIDRALAVEARPADAIREATRVLKPGGKLLVVEEYEALERLVEDGNPLALLRDWVAAGGLICSRLKPADVAESHLLLAVAAADRTAAAA